MAAPAAAKNDTRAATKVARTTFIFPTVPPAPGQARRDRLSPRRESRTDRAAAPGRVQAALRNVPPSPLARPAAGRRRAGAPVGQTSRGPRRGAAHRAKRSDQTIRPAPSRTPAWRRACRSATQHGSRSTPEAAARGGRDRSEEHTSELQSLAYLVCRLLLEKKKQYVT